MESPKPTTPLWRRTLMLAHVATQIPPATRPLSKVIHNNQVCCAFRTTRPPLSVSRRTSAVLDTRINYPHATVTEEHTAHHLPQQLGLRPSGMPHSTLRRQLSAFLAAHVIVSQDSSTASVTLKRAGEGESTHPRGFAFGPWAASGRGASGAPSRTTPSTPTARPRSPTQTLCRRTPIQSAAPSRWNGRKKSFRDPILVSAVRRLQSRSP
jgi:hypothetical protein